MAQQIVEFDRIALAPLSVTSLCSCRPHSDFRHRPTLQRFAAQSNFQKFRFKFDVNDRIHRGVLVNQRRRVIRGVARAELPERIDDGEIENEVISYKHYVQIWLRAVYFCPCYFHLLPDFYYLILLRSWGF